MTAWEKINIARNPSRATSLDYIQYIFDSFIELHGDRCFKDDKSIVCGLGAINNKSFTIIAEQKGRNTKENIERNFGMPNPESYRKALRFMKQAEKFHRPIITFVDTKGAYPGIGAEERGQGEAIAKNIMEMFTLKVPILVFIIGEGSSGGALAIAIGDKVYMLENSVYSILSPEGYASILWKDSSRAQEAAEKMKMTAQDLYNMGIIDKIIEEPMLNNEVEESVLNNKHDTETVAKPINNEHDTETVAESINNEHDTETVAESINDKHDTETVAKSIKNEIVNEISKLECLDIDVLLEKRYNKFRNMAMPLSL